MSFNSRDNQLLGQQLQVQELEFSQADGSFYTVSGSDVVIQIREVVSKVYLAIVKDDSVPSLVVIPAASVQIVDSSAGTVGGDMKAIKLLSLTLAANDVVMLKYVVQNPQQGL